MSLHTPRTLTLVENNPTSVDHYRVQLRAMDGSTLIGDTTYPSDPSGTTVLPIGSNGSMNNLPVDENFRLFHIQQANGVDATSGWQETLGPGGATLVNHLLPDGSESSFVTL